MPDAMDSSQFLCRVSSTLNNDAKNYGKKLMFDGNEETCWNSAEGSPQWIEILFNSPREMKGFEFQFQGGFVGQECVFQFYEEQPKNKEPPIIELNDFYPEDINSVQIYSMPSPVKIKFIRIVFHKSTDFFGRVIVYKLNIL